MRITAVRAAWLRAPIPPERQHRSDFGVNNSFNTPPGSRWRRT